MCVYVEWGVTVLSRVFREYLTEKLPSEKKGAVGAGALEICRKSFPGRRSSISRGLKVGELVRYI